MFARHSHRGLLAVLAAALLAVPAFAAGKKAAPPWTAQIKELRATRLLLSKANHDYAGQRVLAMRDITIALRILEGGAGDRPPADGGGGERQKASDEQLRRAIRQLRNTRGQFAGVKGPVPPRTVAAINSAIKHLETALKIK